MEYKFKKENYSFWVERLKNSSPDRVCTNDTGLDFLESEQILSRLTDESTVLEIGCGNGLLYEAIRKRYSLKRYVGTDFVHELIEECNKKKSDSGDSFFQIDMTEILHDTFLEKFNFIISKRAIQNVIDTQLQLEVIDKLGHFLEDNGCMIFVESSSQAQQRINNERKKYSLDPIDPPFHNLFFNDEKIKSYDFSNVYLEGIVPFASDFYFITRIIYARYAKLIGETLSYDHPLQKVALTMDKNLSTSSYSQIQAYIFRKKKSDYLGKR